MSKTMLIRELFRQDVTRDIPPVVYFHEQSPDKVQDEVTEYIITGGWNKNHPNYKRVPGWDPRAICSAAERDQQRNRQEGWAVSSRGVDLGLLRFR